MIKQRAIGKFRAQKTEKFYSVPSYEVEEGGIVRERYGSEQVPLAPRSYVFAFSTTYKSIDALEAVLGEMSRLHNAFFHGVIVLNEDWFLYQRTSRNDQKFTKKKSRAVSTFAMKLLKDVIRYPMFPADMTRYLGKSE